MSTSRKVVAASAVAALLMMTSAASASLSYTATFGTAADVYAAKAVFSLLSPTSIGITLSNESGVATTDAGNALMGLFFDLTPASALNPGTAVISAGSNLANSGITPPPGSGTDVSKGWEYLATGLSCPGGGSSCQGIGAAGNVGGGGGFGHSNFNPGPSTNIDGADYGIVSANYVDGTGNGSLTNKPPSIRNSVDFTLLAPSGVDLSTFSVANVVFSWGTASDEFHSPPQIPIPAALPLFGTALAGWGALGWRKLRIGRMLSLLRPSTTAALT